MATLTFPQVYGLALNAGFAPPNAVIATSIAFAESSGKTDAIHPNSDQWSSTDWGLMQINDHYHPDLFNKYPNLKTDPVESMSAAHDVFVQAGSSFSPWNTFTGSQYSSYLNQAQVASGAPVSARAIPGVSATQTKQQKLAALAVALVGKPVNGHKIVSATVIGDTISATDDQGGVFKFFSDGTYSYAGKLSGNHTIDPGKNGGVITLPGIPKWFDIIAPGAGSIDDAFLQASIASGTDVLGNVQTGITNDIKGFFDLSGLAPDLWIGVGGILVVLGIMMIAKES